MARKRPDVMKTLAEARPAELDPAHLAGSARAQDDLAAILASTRQAAPEVPRPARAFSWRWAIPVAATAVVAAAVVGTLPRGTSDATGTRASTIPSTHTTPTNGRLAMLNVAARVDRRATTGTYWQVTTRSADVSVIDEPAGDFTVVSSETQQQSFGVRSGTESLWVSGIDDSTEPRTAADKSRWQAAGSPKELTLAGSGTGGGLGLRMGAGSTDGPTVTRINSGAEIAALGARNVTYADLQQLPGDSVKLKALLAKLYKEDGGAEVTGRTAWTWQQAANLINLPVEPAVRAAAYRVIADLPGILSLGEATDPQGRTGTAFALPATKVPGYGSVRQELIVDPTTGALLTEQRTLTAPSPEAADAGLTAGTLIDYTATVKAEWSNSQLKTAK